MMKLVFREDVSVQVNGRDHHTTLQWLNGGQTATAEFAGLTPGVSGALQSLAGSGTTFRELVNTVIKADGMPSLYQFYGYLHTLEKASLVHRFVPNGKGPLVTLAPNSPHYKFRNHPIAPDQRFILSRFACCRREGDQFVIESPLGQAYLLCAEASTLALIFALQKPRCLADMTHQFPAIPQESLEMIFVFLLNAGLLSEVDAQGQAQEDANETLQQWDFHDLLFHARSRNGRTMKGYGGTYRFWGHILPLPAVKPPMSEEYIDLAKPDMEQLIADDHALAAVMEERRSIREYDDVNPITAVQIGEFLYRVARVQHVFQYADVRNGRAESMELSRRPYPGGGAQYELEFYLTIRHCQGIPSGFYHYCPLNHRLHRITSWNDQTSELLKRAAPMPGGPLPQLLITLAARFQRMSWKYESTAYAVTLKNCGVLYQSMYLVATAMGLAPCGIGGGDSDLFAHLAGTDYYAETSVGEFVLGSKPAK